MSISRVDVTSAAGQPRGGHAHCAPVDLGGMLPGDSGELDRAPLRHRPEAGS